MSDIQNPVEEVATEIAKLFDYSKYTEEQKFFSKKWKAINDCLVNLHFNGDINIKIVLSLAVDAYMSCVFSKYESFKDLFNVRELFLEKDIVSTFDDKLQKQIAADIQEKVCQAVEGIYGADSVVPLCTPNFNSPASLFVDGFAIANMLIYED